MNDKDIERIFGDNIPNNWEISSIKDISENAERKLDDGDWVESSDMTENGNYALIQLGNIGVNEFKDKPKRHVNKEFINGEKCMVLYSDDLLISRMAEPIFRTCKVPKIYDNKSITAVDIMRLCPNKKIHNTEYIKNIFNWNPITKQAKAWSSGTTRTRISKTNAMKIYVLIPPIKEQERIASVLYSVDKKLEQLHARKEKHEQLKQGLMQDLLTGEIYNIEEWDEIKIDKLGDINPETKNVKDIDNTFEYISLSNVSDGTLVNKEKYTTDSSPSDRVRILNNKDIIFGKVRPLQKNHFLVNDNNKNNFASLGFTQLRTNENVLPNYLIQILLSDTYTKKFNTLATGSTYPSINVGTFKKVDILIPSIKIQKEIADILGTSDNIIRNTSNLINKYEELKRGLMQDLLSGDVRTSEDLEVLESVSE